MELVVLLILIFPLTGFLINGIFGRWTKPLAGVVASAAIVSSFIMALAVASGYNSLPFDHIYYSWISSAGFSVPFGLRIDSLSLTMLLVVTGVSSLVHIYSIGYMHNDEGYSRYFAFLNLFVLSMIILILADNYLLMFVGWEGVGFCSYILIGHWYKNPAPPKAGIKAFVVNRIGDAGFIIGLLFIFTHFGSLNYTAIFNNTSTLSVSLATVITLFLFVGAVGKSAQFPLYVWLPDAMEGPTPVSALIHAATMVTAGVYMVARSHILYSMSPISSEVVASIGALTAFFAATMALTHTDLKRVLAYSTVSQLGYMFIGVGVGAYWAGIFHLMTHAFFKGLLFLAAGSVMHAMDGLLDMRKMGGLIKKMPHTAVVFIIGALAISGIPPLSGFFSKDTILAEALKLNHPIIWFVGVVTAFMTAFYMFRLIFLTFFGKSRVPDEYHPHESPAVMVTPMWILAALSIAGGLVGLETAHGIPMKNFLSSTLGFPPAAVVETNDNLLMIISVLMGIGGIFLAWLMYIAKPSLPAKLANSVKVLYSGCKNLWWVDQIYNFLFVKPLWWVSHNFLWKVVDVKLIDASVDDVGFLSAFTGKTFRLLQNGFINSYVTWASLGVVVMLGWVIYSGGIR